MQQQASSLQAEFAARLKHAPDGHALTFFNSKEYNWRSFSELYRTSAGIGAGLSGQGLRPGDVCVFVLPSEEMTVEILFGALLIGAVPLMVAPPVVRGLHSNLKDVVEHVIKQTSARVVVIEDQDKEFAEVLQRDNSDTVILFASQCLKGGDPDKAPLAFPGEEDIAAMQLTSGTTGFPRICVWKQKAVMAALDGMLQAMALDDKDICVNWTPLYHDMGLINNFMLCLVKGIPLVMLETMDFLKKPALWLQALSETGATVTWAPNFGFAFTAQRVRDAHLEDVKLHRVKAFWNAAERIHLDTIKTFQERFEALGVSPAAMKTNFGCAENVGGATFSAADGQFIYEKIDKNLLYHDGVARPISNQQLLPDAVSIVGVGRPYPGMSIQILSNEGEILPDGYVGEVALQTPSRMEGYLNNPDETAFAIRDGYLHTGDNGYMRGNELFWVGRVRERINMHGKKFDPSDFERVLLKISGLREGCFATFGIDDEKLGTQQLIIVSEVRDSNTLPYATLLEAIREQVATQIGIKADDILLLPQGAMTKTSSGKRRHRFYRDLYVTGQLEPLASLKQ